MAAVLVALFGICVGLATHQGPVTVPTFPPELGTDTPDSLGSGSPSAVIPSIMGNEPSVDSLVLTTEEVVAETGVTSLQQVESQTLNGQEGAWVRTFSDAGGHVFIAIEVYDTDAMARHSTSTNYASVRDSISNLFSKIDTRSDLSIPGATSSNYWSGTLRGEAGAGATFQRGRYLVAEYATESNVTVVDGSVAPGLALAQARKIQRIAP